MTKPVCVKCELLMRLTKIGVLVVEMVDDRPYKIWSTDVCQCPKCGAEVICRFGNKSISEHWEPEFPGWLEVCRKEGDRKFWGSLEQLESRQVSHESAKSPAFAGSPDESKERTNE